MPRAGADIAPPRECDVAVVGGGIVGLAVARELLQRRPGLALSLLEAETGLARHQTGRSSGVVHAGIYYEPGSLKARLCAEGARELAAYCDQNGVPLRRSGKLIIARRGSELAALDELERRGRANGVEGLRRVDPEGIREIEPHARGLAGLHSPATGVVDFAAVAGALADEVVGAGGSIHHGVRVRGAHHRRASEAGAGAEGSAAIVIEHCRGSTAAREAVFCAGLSSDRLAVACGAPAEPRIVPFRGAYLQVKGDSAELVRGNVYPVPEPRLPFLGAHLTRTIGGNLLVGPSALIAAARDAYRPGVLRPRDLLETLGWPGTWRLAAAHWRTGLAEIRRAASRRTFASDAALLVPELRDATLGRGPVGIRAQAVARDGHLVDDFVLHRTEQAVHVRNAPSPAATSSLALARVIADTLEE